jgi:hypothetical protein
MAEDEDEGEKDNNRVQAWMKISKKFMDYILYILLSGLSICQYYAIEKGNKDKNYGLLSKFRHLYNSRGIHNTVKEAFKLNIP